VKQLSQILRKPLLRKVKIEMLHPLLAGKVRFEPNLRLTKATGCVVRCPPVRA